MKPSSLAVVTFDLHKFLIFKPSSKFVKLFVLYQVPINICKKKKKNE